MPNRKSSGGFSRWNRCCSAMLIDPCEPYRKISVNATRNDGNATYSSRKRVTSDAPGNGEEQQRGQQHAEHRRGAGAREQHAECGQQHAARIGVAEERAVRGETQPVVARHAQQHEPHQRIDDEWAEQDDRERGKVQVAHALAAPRGGGVRSGRREHVRRQAGFRPIRTTSSASQCRETRAPRSGAAPRPRCIVTRTGSSGPHRS